jgi:hypothetical protein
MNKKGILPGIFIILFIVGFVIFTLSGIPLIPLNWFDDAETLITINPGRYYSTNQKTIEQTGLSYADLDARTTEMYIEALKNEIIERDGDMPSGMTVNGYISHVYFCGGECQTCCGDLFTVYAPLKSSLNHGLILQKAKEEAMAELIRLEEEAELEEEQEETQESTPQQEAVIITYEEDTQEATVRTASFLEILWYKILALFRG